MSPNLRFPLFFGNACTLPLGCSQGSLDFNPFDELNATICNGLVHPLGPSAEGILIWDEMLKSKVVRYQVSRIGMDSATAEELYGKYGWGPLRDRQDFFNLLYVLKNDPSYDNVSWHTHSVAPSGNGSGRDCISSTRCLRVFTNEHSCHVTLQVADELRWEDRLAHYNHSNLFPYMVTGIGDTFPITTIGGVLGDVLYQPKYADNVLKLLLIVDHSGVPCFFSETIPTTTVIPPVTGLYTWMGGPTLGSIADSTIMRGSGPPEEKMIKGEVILMDGAFRGIEHVITPWRKPRMKNMPGRWMEYNKGHSYIRARGLFHVVVWRCIPSVQENMHLLSYMLGQCAGTHSGRRA